MTYLEKFRAEHPEAALDDNCLCLMMCPEDLGYEKKEGPCEWLEDETMSFGEACRRCWEREIAEGGAGDAGENP